MTEIPGERPQPAQPLASRKADRVALACSALATLVALYVATQHHEVFVWQELDGYSLQAEKLLSAKWPRDVYRPALYVILSAVGGALLGNCFLAAKVISSLATGGLAWVSYRLGIRIGGTRAGLLACALCCSNSLVLPNGVLAATDMLFALHFNVALLFLLRFLEQPSARRAFWAGVALAVAWFTRYQAIALVPIMLTAVAARSDKSTIKPVAASLLLGTTLGLVPHMTVSWLQFRRPFHDENWRNLALRHFGPEGDWSYLQDNPFDGLLSVLQHDPQRMLQNAAGELWGFLSSGLSQSMGLATSGMPAIVGPIFLAIGAWAAARTNRSATLFACATAASYTALACFAFYANSRFCLPLVPTSSIAVACALSAICSRALPLPAVREMAWRTLALALCLNSAVSTCNETRRLIASQPIEIVTFAKSLSQDTTQRPRVASNYWPLHHFAPIEHSYVTIDRDGGAMWQELRKAAMLHNAEYLLCHRQEAWRVWDHFCSLPTPPDFDLIASSSDFRAYRPAKR